MDIVVKRDPQIITTLYAMTMNVGAFEAIMVTIGTGQTLGISINDQIFRTWGESSQDEVSEFN